MWFMKDTFEHDVTMPQSPPEVELLAPASVCLVLVRIIRAGEIKSYPKPQSGWISACDVGGAPPGDAHRLEVASITKPREAELIRLL